MPDQDPGGNNGPPRDPDYWCAYLAAAIGGALVTKPFHLSKAMLKRTLQEFTRSRECSLELREIIRDIQKGEHHEFHQ